MEGAEDQGLVELQAISSIYGDDAKLDAEQRSIHVALPNAHAIPRISVSLQLPLDYPSHSPPVVSTLIACPDHVDASLLAWASRFIEILFNEGEEVIFVYLTWLSQQRELFGEAEAEEEALDGEEGEGEEGQEEGSRDIPPVLSPDPVDDAEEIMIQAIGDRIVTGTPVVEKRSTFLAHCCRVDNVAEVKFVIRALLRSSKIRQATHPCIMAYRINKTTSDCDDDGESSAGSRLLHLLHLTEAENVVVVVSRWFGGILLGPSRFGLINNAARTLLEQEGFIRKGGGTKGGSKGSNKG